MKIAFFSEIGSNIGTYFPRDFHNQRTDTAWAVALNAPVLNLGTLLEYNSQFQPRKDETSFDLGIIIVPKNNPNKAFDCFKNNQKYCKQWSSMQEAQNSFWQSFSIENQVQYLNFLSEVDHIFAHNEIDVKYYKGLIPNKNVSVMQSLMIEDAIPVEAEKVPLNRSSCIIGGNMCEWYGGMDSFLIAQEFGEQIYIPSMGRKVEGEEHIEGLNHLPYMNWSEWMATLNQFKYAVHLMRTYAAGTFSLNCARLKIPTIGWNSLDTQHILFPELSFDEGDMISARKAAKHLKENQQFYNHCSEYAFKMYNEIYREESFIKKFKDSIEIK